MEKSKWTYKAIVTGIAAIIISLSGYGGTLLPKTDTEIETMIKYAQRQALEIAIIEQASKLTDYRQQLAAAKQPVAKPIAPTPPMTMPLMPEIADPKDVDVDK